jgi:hypothetical protein
MANLYLLKGMDSHSALMTDGPITRDNLNKLPKLSGKGSFDVLDRMALCWKGLF